jgi:flagellar export protein FliJ
LQKLRGASSYETVLRAELAALVENEQLAQAEVARCQQALLEAQRDLEALDKLRDRRSAEFHAEAARRETRQFDEVAARRQRQQPAC